MDLEQTKCRHADRRDPAFAVVARSSKLETSTKAQLTRIMTKTSDLPDNRKNELLFELFDLLLKNSE